LPRASRQLSVQPHKIRTSNEIRHLTYAVNAVIVVCTAAILYAGWHYLHRVGYALDVGAIIVGLIAAPTLAIGHRHRSGTYRLCHNRSNRSPNGLPGWTPDVNEAAERSKGAGMGGIGDHHEFRQSSEPPASSSDRSFGLVFAGCFALLTLHNWWLAGRAWPIYLAIAAVFLAAALLRPNLLHWPNRAWIRLGSLLGAIVTPIVMALLFFLVITPIGLMMRLAGKDTLRRGGPRQGDSYWIVRDPPGPSGESMSEQF
jgi:saxitoxin biosynthesis operon SxtJ-like protein